MHAIVMVHKMQRMALSSHLPLPPTGKADSENTRNSENDSGEGPEGDAQGDGPNI
jgi:hypothetical protein